MPRGSVRAPPRAPRAQPRARRSPRSRTSRSPPSPPRAPAAAPAARDARGWRGRSSRRGAARGRSRPVPYVAMAARTDLVVVGAGAAGLYACLCAVREGARVVLVSARPLAETASYWAQGGAAAALTVED